MMKIKVAACLMTLALILIGSQITNVTKFKTTEPCIVTNDKAINDRNAIKKNFYGEWLVSDYVATAELLDLNPLPEGYNSPPDKKFENTKILFDDSSVIDFSEPSELGFVYENTDDMVFGYQIPLKLKGPITYVCIQHVAFKSEINFIQDSEKNTYIEINYNYYKLKKI